LVVINSYTSWNDFFHPGWGYDLELDIFFGNRGPGPHREPGFNYGATVLLGMEEFGGNTVHGVAGNSISVENLTMGSLLVGGKVLQTLGGGFYADGHVGLGVVHYSSVQGTFDGPGFTQFKDTVFEDTWTFASELKGHAAIGWARSASSWDWGSGFRRRRRREESSICTRAPSGPSTSTSASSWGSDDQAAVGGREA